MDLLLSITVALGILYVNLKAARYRDKLHDAMMRVLSDTWLYPESMEVLLATDGHFASKYHEVSRWMSELPDWFLDEGEGSECASVLTGGENVELPWLYRWFQSNGDKNSCFVLGVVLPVAGVWLAYFYPKAEWLEGPLFWVCLSGQMCVALHVFLGLHMVRKYVDRFTGMARDIEVALQQEYTKKLLTPA